jgi:hypothetical protein
MQPGPEHDRLDPEPSYDPMQACPRCYEALRVADLGEDGARSMLLACPETYCDYVLVVTQRESFSGRKWSWPELFRLSARAAG